MSQDTPSQNPSLREIGAQHLLAGAVLVVVMVLGFWQMLAGSRNVDYSTIPTGWDNFWTGQTTQTLEKRLDHAVPARPYLIMVANAARYWITGGAGPKVWAGDENWLFLTEELQVDVAAPDRLQPRLELYYRTDTHWNQTGAELAAKAVATWSAENAPLEGGTAFELRRDGEEAERIGDLLALIGLDKAPAWLRPRGDFEAPVTVDVGSGASTDAVDDLFGEASVPVVLLGTSYSQRAAFSDFLRLHLSSDVLNAAKDGGRIAGSAKDYFADDAFSQTPPQLVVWEVPERFLTLPLDAGQTEPTTLLPAP